MCYQLAVVPNHLAPDAKKLWAGLLGYCGDPLLAAQCLDVGDQATQSFVSKIAEIDRLRPESPSIVDYSAIGGDYAEVRSAIEKLAQLPTAGRADAIESRLFPAGGPSALSERELFEPDELDRALSVLLETTVPARPVEPPVSAATFGVVAAILFGLVFIIGLVVVQRDDPEGAVPRSTSIPTAPLPATTEVQIDLESLVADPDRVLDIALETDGTIVRRDALTAEIIWRSRQYRDATAVRIDADVVTVVRASGWTTYLNLTDGTQLPP